MNISKIIFLCSPSIGCIDTCAPVIENLAQETGVETEIFIPKIELIFQFTQNPILMSLISSWRGKVIVATPKGMVTLSNEHFPEMIRLIKKNKLIHFLRTLPTRLFGFMFRKQLSRALLLNGASRFNPERTIQNDEMRNPSKTVVIGDLLELTKPYLRDFKTYIEGAKFFSINHGIDIDLRTEFPKGTPIFPLEDCKCFLFSKNEIPYYKSRFSLSDENIAVVGIQKHDPIWLRRLDEITAGMGSGIGQGDVLLIGRPHGLSYLTHERKHAYLKDIKTVLIDGMGCRIIVKRHPKEHDLSIYRSALGPKGKNWIVSEEPLHVLAARTDFSLSFFSGTCTDIISMGKPIIEYISIDSLNLNNDIDVKIMPNGKYALTYEYFGLVLPASDRKSFEQQVFFVFNEKEAAIKQLKKAYNSLFEISDGSIEKTKAHILKSLV
jgi:hypothetical protein